MQTCTCAVLDGFKSLGQILAAAMAPKKRAATAATPETPKLKKAKRESSALSPDEATKRCDAMPTATRICELFQSDVKEKNMTVPSLLDAEFPTQESQLEFARWIEESFPGIPGVEYMSNFEPGVKCARRWLRRPVTTYLPKSTCFEAFNSHRPSLRAKQGQTCY